MNGSIGRLKRQVITQLLEEEDYLLVVVHPACAGVLLPEPLLAAGQPVALHLGWRMSIPIPDLQLGEEAITGTLSFNRTPFRCVLPWAAVVQVSAGDEHLIWLCPESAIKASPAPAPKEEKERPKLRLV